MAEPGANPGGEARGLADLGQGEAAADLLYIKVDLAVDLVVDVGVGFVVVHSCIFLMLIFLFFFVLMMMVLIVIYCCF